jgi:hypothetical protein
VNIEESRWLVHKHTPSLVWCVILGLIPNSCSLQQKYRCSILGECLLTPRCWVFLQKLIVIQLVKKFPTFMETKGSLHTKFYHWTLPWFSWIQFTPLHHTSCSDKDKIMKVVNSVFGLEKVDWWNPIRTSAIQSRSHTMQFLGIFNHEKGGLRQEISKWSMICSMFLRSGLSVSTLLAPQSSNRVIR